MRLEHFQYIVEIARCKSMSKASKKLYITQPSLSTAIQNLEEELGFQIFKRSAAGVALTEKGEELLKISEEMVKQLGMIKDLSDPDKESVTTLNLAAVPVFCNSMMIDLIQLLRKNHPHINVNIMELRPTKILSALISGQADLAIGTFSPSTKEQVFQEAAKHNITIEPLYEDEMYCFLHRNHPLARNTSVTFEDLISGDTIPAFFNDYALMGSYEGLQQIDTEFSDNYYSFTDRASIKKAVSKGLAYAHLPHLMAYDDIYVTSGMIIPVPLADADVSLTNYLAYSARNPLPKSAKLTMELIRQLYKRVEEKRNAERRKIEKELSDKHNQYLLY